MKLTYFQSSPSNFGDELNAYLWQRLLPAGFLDADASALFLGIGSILWDYLPREPHKFIVGSGYGGYAPPPDVHDGSWTPVFVRGPRTAKALGLAPELAICDSAILLRLLHIDRPSRRSGVGFMPHFHSAERGYWSKACRLAGIQYIDPTAPVADTLTKIAGLELLISEAMHGAIVADALRTPWIAAKPIHSEHHLKWLDWSEAIDVEVRWAALRPSSVLEAYIALTGGTKFYQGRAVKWGQHKAAAPVNSMLTAFAARRLSQLSTLEPQLSDERRLDDLTTRAVDSLRRTFDVRVGETAM